MALAPIIVIWFGLGIGSKIVNAALVRNNQVDALSMFDTQFALVENAGIGLRLLDTREIDRYP